MVEGEEGQDRAGPAGLVPVIQVVGARIVEIDGLLDEPQAENPGVAGEVALRRAGIGWRALDGEGRVLASSAGEGAARRLPAGTVEAD